MSDGIDIKIHGVERTLARLMEIGKDADVALMEAVLDEAQPLAARAVEKCPKLSGRLSRSVAIVLGDRMVTIRFRAPYAAAVHERTDVKHQNGEAKFLESSLDERSAGYQDRVAAKVKAKIGG